MTLSLIVGTLAVLAVLYDGEPVRDVELNDGGVWVTNGQDQLMARLNSQIDELELGMLTSATSDAVFQDGASVQVFDDGGGSADRAVWAVDPVFGTAEAVPLPSTFVAAAGGGTVAIIDRDSGKVWIRRSDRLREFDPELPPDTEVPPRSQVVVGQTGTAFVADRTAGVVTAWSLDATGAAVKGEAFDFETEFTDGVALTVVGETPVALQEGILLRVGEDPARLEGEEAVLQQPGPAADVVRLATDDGLWRAQLAGEDVTRIGEVVDGPPAAPVVVARCVHGAWRDVASQHSYQRVCGGDLLTEQIPQLTDAAELTFRANRDVVVLNDVAAGGVWVIEDGIAGYLDDWDSVNPRADDPQKSDATDERRDNRRNRPPEAKKDDFGARPGSTVVLPVTLNDIDPDGDILTLTGPPASSSPDVALSVTGDGTQVQAQVGPNVRGSVTFEYQISDGRPGHTSKAEVTVTLYEPGTDEAPAKVTEFADNRLTVADGRESSLNVLPAWIDPEGDALLLESATSEGGRVDFRPDGTITFVDDGQGPGAEEIEFEISGGGASTTGRVAVRVVAAEAARPTAVPDRFTGLVGSDILLTPLANDSDPLGAQLRLADVRGAADGGGGTVGSRDGERGTATFRAGSVGSYFLTYEVESASGLAAEHPATIRVDVEGRSGNNRPPVTTRDLAAVPDQGSALVDVLANDSDPDGDVLVVQGVEVEAQWRDAVTASLVNKQFVRVETTGDLGGAQPEIRYLVSDGDGGQSDGAIAVVAAADDADRPPKATDDTFTVRAGTIVTLPVLDNDEDPDGDPLTLAQSDLADVGGTWISDQQVPIVATGSSIRVQVPDDPDVTQVQFGYGVRDPARNLATGVVLLHVTPDDADHNQDPAPRPIEARTVSGQEIRVPVDIFGSDPDGDPVVFTGVQTPPELGRIVDSGAGWFSYEPFEGDDTAFTGTDEFTIKVADPYGGEATTTVRIGVAPRVERNQPPAALDDRVAIRPGVTVQYPILANDADADGDPLILDEDSFQPPDSVSAEIVDNAIKVEAQDLGGRREVVTGLRYSVTDGLGEWSSAVLTVVTSEDAPHHAPIAQDDVVTADLLVGQEVGDWVEVDVLANDGDLDGGRDALELTALDPEVSEVVDRKLRVRLAEQGRVVAYHIADRTEQFSFGFVYVPGIAEMRPRLNMAAVPVEIVAGEEEVVDLADVIVVRPGHRPALATPDDPDSITAGNVNAAAEGAEGLRLRAAEDYHGPAWVGIEVMDGADLQDPDSRFADLTVPVTVLPSRNVPPEVRDTSLVLYAGGDPATVDLGRLATDANDDDLAFTLGATADDVEIDIAGEVLTLRAEDDAPSSNGEVAVEVLVDDGTADPVTATVWVTVIGIDPEAPEEIVAEPMVLLDRQVPDATAGEAVVVDVVDQIAFDPFPDEPKEVTEVSVAGPAPQPTVTGTSISVTPDAAGEVVVTYGLDDGSGDANRVVEGHITLVVADVPDRPGKPVATPSGADTVQLAWQAPADNGSPIRGYLVEWDGGDQECRVTQCLIEGLEPGESYAFTVTAENDLGPGEPSPASDRVTPDKRPEQMAAPVIAEAFDDRDGQLHLQWTAPDNDGSAITAYTITTNGEQRTAGPDATTMVWDGLANGRSYVFRIRAENAAGEGEWSAPSAEAVPYTVPEPMPAPTLKAIGNGQSDGGGYLEVSWAPLAGAGSGFGPDLVYEVTVLRDGADYTTVDVVGGTGTTAMTRAFDVENGHSYTAQVRARNRAGVQPAWSPESGAQITYDKASQVTDIDKTSDCPSDACKASTSSYVGQVTFSAPADNGGYAVTKYRYTTTDGHIGYLTGVPTGAGATVSKRVAFNGNGQNQTVTITPITSVPGVGEVEGTANGSGTKNDFDPYAKPFAPSKTCGQPVNYYTVKVCWNASGKGNGRSVDKTEFDGPNDGGIDTGAILTGWKQIAVVEGGTTACLTTRTHTAAGWSEWSGDMCGTSEPRLVRLSYYNYGSCDFGTCVGIKLRLEGFRKNSSQTAQPWINGGVTESCGKFGPEKWARSPRTVTVGADGTYYGTPGTGGRNGSGGAYYLDTDCNSTNKWVVDGQSSPWVHQ